MQNNITKFLDTTIRDGGYTINFQFSVSDIERIVSALENVGFEYIEIGHGLGLNASNSQSEKALQTDLEYMQVAKESLKKAQYGMFCIPNIARLDDIKLAAENNMGFIRVGTNVTEIDTAKDYIKEAKNMKMLVMSNLMKSYVVSPDIFGEYAKKVESYGADVVYIVDSAGSMLTDDVKRYIEAVRKNTDLKIGFHGHNNLGLAVANSVAAYEEQIDFVDTTMQGLGRSAGNAAAELVLAVLMKKGYDVHIDFLELMMKSKALIHPLVRKHGINPLDVVSGISEFHSSYLKAIHRISTKYKVNPLELIMLYSEQERVNLNEALMEEIAKTMPVSKIATIDLDFWEYLS